MTIAEVEGNYLILPVPELYVLPGLVGRQDIFCFRATEHYEARLISPGKFIVNTGINIKSIIMK